MADYIGSVKGFLAWATEDIDVYDDYDERCGCAYCPTTELTEEGEKKFALALSLNCSVYEENCIVECRNSKEAQAVADLFYSIAGYCSDEDWHRWFYYPDREEPEDLRHRPDTMLACAVNWIADHVENVYELAEALLEIGYSEEYCRQNLCVGRDWKPAHKAEC